MNLNQLTYFVALAQIQHYTRAAKRLSITQPSLSHAISTLEEEIGVPLFERQGRNVVLTKYGDIFLKYVQQSLHSLNTGVEQTRKAAKLAGGKISVGYIHTQGSEFVPKLVRGFLDSLEEKQIDFHFHNDVSLSLIQGLKEEKYDVVFCSKVEGEKEVKFFPVSEEKLVAVVPKKHPLAEQEKVTIGELSHYPQISFLPTSGLHFVIRQLFEDQSLMPETVFEVEEDGALAGLVAEGFGVGIVPDVPAIRHLPVKKLEIENLDYRRYIYMGILKSHCFSAAVEDFVAYIEKNYVIHE